MMYTRTESRTPTTTSSSTTSTPTSTKTTTTTASSSSTRARAREELLELSVEDIRKAHLDIFGRPMPRWTENQLRADLEEGTPSIYYRYALSEAANAPFPSWRYTMAIVTRLKRQNVPEDDLLFLL